MYHKKNLILFVSSILISSSTILVGAEVVNFSIGISSGVVGAKATTPLVMENGSELGVLQLNVIYDPVVLEPVTIKSAKGVNAVVDFHVVKPGTLQLDWVSSQGIENDGELVLIEWEVVGGVATRLEIEVVKAWGNNSLELAVSTTAGEFAVDVAPLIDGEISESKIPTSWIAGIIVGLALIAGLVAFMRS